MLGLPVWAGVVMLVAAILAFQALVWVLVARPWVRRRLETARHEATLALGGEVPLLEGAVRSFGEQSRGRSQVRGTGHLAVTDDAVVFVLAAPRRVVRIPRAAVTGVDEAASHLGKRVGRPLLRIAWTREDGRPDVIAFDVGRATARWREALAAG